MGYEEMYLGVAFLKNNKSLDDFDNTLRILLNKFPSFKTNIPISEIAKYFYNSWSYEYEPNRNPSICFQNDIEIDIINEEYNESSPWVYNGHRQIEIKLQSETPYPPLTNRLIDDRELAFGLIPFLSYLCRSLDVYLAIFSGPDNFEVVPDFLFWLDPEYKEFCVDGEVDSKLREIFLKHNIQLSSDATIKKSDKRTPYFVYVVDNESIYRLSINRSDISVSDYSYLYQSENQEYKDIEYIERMLHNKYFTEFYFDNILANDIGLDVLGNISEVIVHLDNHGYYVNWRFNTGESDYEEKYRIFISKILPKIANRLKIEYSEYTKK